MIAVGATVYVAFLALEFTGVETGLGRGENALMLGGLLLMLAGVSRRFAGEWRRGFAAGGALRAGQLLWVGLWFGMATGLAEAAVLGVRKFLIASDRARPLYASPYDFSLIPIVDMAIFAVPSLLCWLLIKLRPRAASGLAGPFLLALATMAFCGLLFRLHPTLEKKASVLLAIGAAVTLANSASRSFAGFSRFVRRSAPWLGAVILAITLVIFAWRRLPESFAHAALPDAAEHHPNVVLVVLDTVRAKSLSLHGYPRATTPRLEEFASRGVKFDNALSTSPWTLPSHATMFTGHYPNRLWAPHETPLTGVPLGPEAPTLAEALGAHGYLSAGFVANTVYCSYLHGLNRGFVHYEDYVLSFEGALKSSSLGGEIHGTWLWLSGRAPTTRKSADDINGAFLSWLGGRDDDEARPYFAFLNYFDAHDPYQPPAPWDKKFGGDRAASLGVEYRKYSPAEIVVLRDAYDCCLAYLDAKIGELFDELERRGELEDTLVIITSDHGEHFGEHGLMYHANSLYRPLLHVPLLVSFPGRVPSGRVVDRVVSLRDLPATVMGLLGLNVEPEFPGASLARYWDESLSEDEARQEVHMAEILVGDERPKWWPNWWPTAKGGMTAFVSRGLHFIKLGNGAEKVFDFDQDPLERNDLRRLPRGRAASKAFKIELEGKREKK